jgi:hypothetical protein
MSMRQTLRPPHESEVTRSATQPRAPRRALSRLAALRACEKMLPGHFACSRAHRDSLEALDRPPARLGFSETDLHPKRRASWLRVIISQALSITACGSMFALPYAQALAGCLSPPGDVNGDSSTTVVDVQCTIIVALADLGGASSAPTCLPEGNWERADLNCSDGTTVSDVQVTIQLTLGTALPAQVDSNGNSCSDSCESEICATAAAMSPCNDADPCTVGDKCLGGQCVGQPKCNDGAPCTADACAIGVCSFSPLTSVDACCCELTPGTIGGCATASCRQCVSAASPICDESWTLPCTVLATTVCDEVCGCFELTCDDGNACTTNDRCLDGECVGDPRSCDDANVCTTDSCIPATGCVYAPTVGTPCDDDRLCTTGDHCSGGNCVGVAVPCDDGLDCTADSCQEPCEGFIIEGSCYELTTKGLTWTAARAVCQARGGDLATISSMFENSTVRDFIFSSAPNPPPPVGVWLGYNDRVDEGIFEWADGSPSEFSFWTGGGPFAHSPEHDFVVMRPGGFWFDETETEWGDLSGLCERPFSSDLCAHVADPAKACDDGKPCTRDVCDESGECANRTLSARCCSSQQTAGCGGTSCESCVCAFDPFCCETQWDQLCANAAFATCAGVCQCDDLSCRDEDRCTVAEICADGQCKTTPLTCTGSVCQGAHCEPDKGCVPELLSRDCCEATGAAGCSNEPCEACVCALNPACCAEGYGPECAALASEACAATCQCENTTCSDGNFCTTDDTCKNGVCVTKPVNCDDGNSCTTDVCGGAPDFVICAHFPAEDDNDLCTVDACTPGQGCDGYAFGESCYKAKYYTPPTKYAAKLQGNVSYYNKRGTSWSNAVYECVQQGGTLARIDSAEENEHVRNVALAWCGQFAHFAWIDASDLVVEGTFANSAGEPLGYTNWATSGPGTTNIAVFDVVAMSLSDGKWYLTQKEAGLGCVVCEFPVSGDYRHQPAECEGACGTPHASPGCDNNACTQCVCDLDPLCCSGVWDAQCVACATGTGGRVQCGQQCKQACWSADKSCGNGVCGSGENCANCPTDCGVCSAAGCCSEHQGTGCAVDPSKGGNVSYYNCQICVCTKDPYCCDVVYDAECAACAKGTGGRGFCSAQESCAQFCEQCHVCGDGNCAPGEHCCEADCGNGCSGSCCSAHGGLGCDSTPCRSCICENDPDCCEVAWDAQCAACATNDASCPYGDTCVNACLSSCGRCGDGVCAGGEYCCDCPADCGSKTGDYHTDKSRGVCIYDPFLLGVNFLVSIFLGGPLINCY